MASRKTFRPFKKNVWMGDVVRMPQEKVLKAVINRTYEGRKKREIPRKQWRGEMNDNLKKINVIDLI